MKENPESIGFPREDWIHQFDTEKYAEDMFEEVFKSHVESRNTANVPLFSGQVTSAVVQ